MFVNRSATGLFMFPKTCHLYWFQIFSQTKSYNSDSVFSLLSYLYPLNWNENYTI